MQVTRTYLDKDGCKNNIAFVGDWLFASELLLYVEHTYGIAWGIYTCSQIGPDTYSAHFRPKDGQENYRDLYIHIVRSEDPEIGWIFSQS